MAAATSWAVTRRPVGWRAPSAARSAAGSAAASSRRPTHGVSTVPGLTQFTRMPSRTWSAAMARVSERTAPLLAEYSARCGRPAVAAIEQVLITEADAESRRYGRAARVVRTIPRTLTSRTRCHCSSGLSSTVPVAPMPALLTRMSIPPSASAAPWTAARTARSSQTSALKRRSGGRAPLGSRSRTATWAPRSLSRWAVARPMPEAPPVTRAVSPSRSVVTRVPPSCRSPGRPPRTSRRGRCRCRGWPGAWWRRSRADWAPGSGRCPSPPGRGSAGGGGRRIR